MKRMLLACALALLLPANARAWGSAGHLIINRLAAESLPATLPAFLRTPDAIAELTLLGPEEDRIKGAGESWDDDNDPGHFLDTDDALGIAGVVKLNALPPSMAAYAQALDAAHTTPYKQGFLPYSIIDGFERLRKDFAIWRVDDYMSAHASGAAGQAFAKDRALRETLILRDIGDWGHFVGDGSQPLHNTVHFSGWGEYPNPKGYSVSRHVHSMFESDFVSAHLSADAVRAKLPPYTPPSLHGRLSQSEVASIVGGYLTASALAVGPLYELEKAGGFSAASPAAVEFAATHVARGAAELRDLTALAFEDSINERVGYPAIAVRDILAGKVAPRVPNPSD